MKRKLTAIIGIIAGIIIIVFGIKQLNQETGVQIYDTTTFGADYYTDSYDAMRKTVNNTQILNNIVRSGTGFIIISIGISDIAVFLYKFVDSFGRDDN